MSKYIIFSDIHLHNYSGGVDPETRMSKRLLIQKSILQQVIDLTIQEDAILIFGGDLVHAVGNVPVEVLNVIHWFFEEIKKCGIKFYAAQGNHDQVIRKNCPATHSILSPFQNRTERDKDLSLMKPTIRLVDYDQIDDVESVKGFDIVVIHAQPDLVNKHKFHMEGVNWKKIVKNNKFVFFGHDHTRRELSKFCYVIGSPMQLTMNDVGEDRGCYLVNSEDWKVKFIKLDYPELKRLEKVEEKEESKFEERIKATSFQDILVEWLNREQKPQSYLDLIQKDIEDKIQVSKTFFNGKIQSIYLSNFLSVDEIKVELKNGFWLVMGDNGTGKTTIVGEGIYWILFDTVTKDMSKQEIVRDRPTKQKEAIGELCLVNDKEFYTIRRSSKNGLEIWQYKKNLVDGMTKVQAQEFLEKHILGFDKNTYLASCYFSQKGLLTLAQLGDADTTNLVTNLLGFETYDSLYITMDVRKKEVTLQLELLEQSSVKLDNELWKNSEQQKSLKEQIEMFTKQECSLKDEQSKVNQQLNEFNDLLGKIVIPIVTTEELDVSLLALNSSKSKMSTKLRTLQENGQKVQQAQNRIDKEKTKLETEKRLKLESISNHEAIISSLKENKCVYCGTILKKDELEKHLGEELATISLIKSTIVDNAPELNKEMDMWYDKEAENNDLISATNEEITIIDKQIDDLHYKKLAIVKEQTEANSRKSILTNQIKQLEQRGIVIVNQLKNVNIDAKSLQLKELENNAINLVSEKDIIISNKNKLIENLAIYDFWHNTFSNKGIRPLLLDKFVNEFNSVVKQYCYKVSNGEFIVQFTPTAKTQAGLERNKLGLQVIYKDKIESYGKLSGGEATRVNLPLCFGLNKWISKKYGIENGIFGIMILDELFCYTDEKFRDNVADLLNDEGKSKAIFVIDHADTLVSYTDNLWLVTKQNEVTQLQVV